MGESINICVPIFNRATYARVRSIFVESMFDTEVKFTILAGSGLLDSKYGKAIDIIREELPHIKIYELDYTPERDNPERVNFISAEIQKSIATHLISHKYDGGLVIADRFETLPAAMALTYSGIPLMHLQGGEVTGNIDERVRHAVTKLSDYHFACTSLAKKYIIQMGEEQNRVFFTGCPSLDAIKEFAIRRNTPDERYIMCIFHPDTENLDVQVEQTTAVLNAVLDYCAKYGCRCYWYWPNPDKGREKVLEVIEKAHKQNDMFLTKAVNLSPKDFLKQLSGAKVVIGNSSVGIRECSYIGVPAINIGDRQSIRERSHNVLDVEPQWEQILKGLEAQTAAKKYKRVYLFGDGDANKNIISHIKRFVWSKKGPITYPYQWENKREHFEEERFKRHSSRQSGWRTQGKMASGRAI